MKNHPFGKTKFFRRDGTKVLSNAMADRGLDPLEVFDSDEQALRRDIGDLRFVEYRGGDSATRRAIFLIPEFPTSVYYDEMPRISALGLSMQRGDFGDSCELDIKSPGFQIISWEDGCKFVDEQAKEDTQIANSKVYRVIKELDAKPRTTLSAGDIRGRIGPETGGRFEMGLLS